MQQRRVRIQVTFRFTTVQTAALRNIVLMMNYFRARDSRQSVASMIDALLVQAPTTKSSDDNSQTGNDPEDPHHPSIQGLKAGSADFRRFAVLKWIMFTISRPQGTI
jgi:hypothetical protein